MAFQFKGESVIMNGKEIGGIYTWLLKMKKY